MSEVSFSLWPRLSSLSLHDQWMARSNEHATVFRTTWPEFAEWLAQPLEGAVGGGPVGKHEQAFSPLSAIQPGKGGRIAGGPASFLALEYDDSASPKALAAAKVLLQSGLDGKGHIASVIYTTASATPRCPRFRVVMPVTQPLDDAAYASCVDHFGKLVGVRPSPESRQRSRLWYRPIAGAQVWTTSTDGRPWNVAASLEACPPPPPRVPPPAPSADALAHWPLAERVRQAWARLLRVRPAGAFAAGCCCHDHGVPEDVARSLLWAYATMQGWVFDEADIADRLEHAYEYARDPFGCQLQPSVLTDDQLRQRIAGAVGVGR